MLTTTVMATTAPVMIAPAMNTNMYLDAATQANIETLKRRGCEFIAPATGHLACGAEQAAHRRLTSAHPKAVVPATELAGAMNVVREIYRPMLLPMIEAELDRIAAEADRTSG